MLNWYIESSPVMLPQIMHLLSHNSRPYIHIQANKNTLSGVFW